MEATITCKNCGHHFEGKYCNYCGEKLYTQKDKSLSHITEETFHFITHFDGTFLTSVKNFLTRPGHISADYVHGIRKKYFKPVSFFLLIVVAYFLFPRFHGLNMQFQAYIDDGPHSWYAIPIAKQVMLSKRLSGTELGNSYDEHSPAVAKLALLLLIPLSALLLSLLYRKPRKFFFDHFILATEIISFYIFFSSVFLPLVTVIMEKTIPDWHFFDQYSATWRLVFLYITVFTLLVFTIAAFKTFYKQAWWLSILKALLFIFAFGTLIIYVYRLILYFLILLFV